MSHVLLNPLALMQDATQSRNRTEVLWHMLQATQRDLGMLPKRVTLHALCTVAACAKGWDPIVCGVGVTQRRRRPLGHALSWHWYPDFVQCWLHVCAHVLHTRPLASVCMRTLATGSLPGLDQDTLLLTTHGAGEAGLAGSAHLPCSRGGGAQHAFHEGETLFVLFTRGKHCPVLHEGEHICVQSWMTCGKSPRA